MRLDQRNINDILKRDFDVASDQEASQAGVRVWHRLQASGASTPDARLDETQPPVTRNWRGVRLAAAAVLVLAGVLGTAVVWRPAETALYRVIEGDVRQGAMLRSNDGRSAMIALSDGSRVEMRSNSELAVERANDGIRIRLTSGGIIVNAAKQRTGHLYVQTKDMTVSVVGTVFLVNADTEGSRVSVIEGEVRVRQGSSEQTLQTGGQIATNPRMPPPPVIEEIAWSRNLQAHSHLLEQSVTLTIQPGQQIRLELSPLLLDLPGLRQDALSTRPANTPPWEVIAIRPCSSEVAPGARGGGTPGVVSGGIRMDPSFLRVECMRLRYLIEDAYVKYLEPDAFRRRSTFPVTGGPSWLDTDHYSIDAKPAGGPVDRQTMGGPMLQVLLEERFKLKLRREIRQEPVYELRIADGGFKLQPLKEGECESRKRRLSEVPAGDGVTVSLPMFTGSDGRAVAMCGFTEYGMNRPNPGARTPRLYGADINTLVYLLGGLDRTVLDKTGIKGLFDIEFTYGADVSPMREPAPAPPAPSGADSIFDALRKQLGLDLVPTMGPRTYYYVEHVERPMPN
jgi:uncharacterized protein (TIGR03435 family)